jgi:hypothetical protein
MKAKLLRFVLAGLVACLGVSCTTAYDAYGYPQQVVDPGVAIAGAAAVGLLAYGLANSDNHHHNHGYNRSYYRGYSRNYYRPSHYHGGYYGHSRNCW